MNKLIMLVFGGLTAGAIYLTAADLGVGKPVVEKPSVRTGSSGFLWVGGGGSRVK